LRLAQEREQLRVVADQFGTPTSARCLARQSLHACSVALGAPSDAAPWGLYHLSCAGATDWHSYAAHVLARASQWGAPLKVHAPQVQAISSNQYPTPAPRWTAHAGRALLARHCPIGAVKSMRYWPIYCSIKGF
jgi:dTDP-4-dehydrorhamnose reductase